MAVLGTRAGSHLAEHPRTLPPGLGMERQEVEQISHTPRPLSKQPLSHRFALGPVGHEHPPKGVPWRQGPSLPGSPGARRRSRQEDRTRAGPVVHPALVPPVYR